MTIKAKPHTRPQKDTQDTNHNQASPNHTRLKAMIAHPNKNKHLFPRSEDNALSLMSYREYNQASPDSIQSSAAD